MPQWGEIIEFSENHTTIRVLAHVETKGFEPAMFNSRIDDLLLLDVSGDEPEAADMFQRLKQRFIGREYRAWLAIKRHASIPD